MFLSEQFLFENLGYYSKKIWYAITCLLIVFIFFVWWKIFFFPMNKIIKQHKENLIAIQNQHNNTPPNNNINLKTQYSIDDSKFLKTSQVTLFILQNIQEKNLELKVSNSSPEIAKSFYKKSVFEFEISGKFEHVLNFLKDIRLSNCLLKITKCQIKKNDEKNVTCHLILHSLCMEKNNPNIYLEPSS